MRRYQAIGYLALAAGVLIAAPGLGQQPAAAKLTPAQQARLRERDRLQAEVQAQQRAGKLDEAIAAARKVLALEQEVYGPAHEDVACTWELLAELHEANGSFALARQALQEVQSIRQRLYGARDWRTVDAARALEDLATRAALSPEQRRAAARLRQEAAALDAREFGLYRLARYAEAVAVRKQSLALRQQLSPPEQYPRGHADLATSLNNLGFLLQARGALAQAEPFSRDALAMYQGWAATFADRAAEAEALALLATLPATRDLYLDITARLDGADPGRVYAVLWAGKSALAQALERRRRLLATLADPRDRRRLGQLLELRRQLAELALAPASGPSAADRAARLRALTERRERLESDLAGRVPALALEQAQDRSRPADLDRALPADSAFVDLYRYFTWDAGQRAWGRARYAAFVLVPERPLRRVELGAAGPIEAALGAWRRDIEAGGDQPPATVLVRLWERFDLPTTTRLVYVCPDGPLAALPWAALPTRRRGEPGGAATGRVLLEDCAIALVPHGPMLAQQLTRATPRRPGGTLLAVGAVDYDGPPDPTAPHVGEELVLRPAERSGPAGPWTALAGTASELDRLAALARALPGAPPLAERRGRAAGVAQVLADLPRARVAHLATHGFFAAPQTEERRRLYAPDAFLMEGRLRLGAAARHPLLQVGLVLAGANRPGARGLLTGEALAGLPLDGLDLVVLSACDSGRGEANVGEGVYGLQRAFHVAGCPTVVASLWKVDDDATAALMAVFYHQLWVEKQPPLEALRRAQLALLHHPADVPALAKGRGADFTEAVQRVGRPTGPKEERPKRSPVKHWAAFVLSGAGR